MFSLLETAVMMSVTLHAEARDNWEMGKFTKQNSKIKYEDSEKNVLNLNKLVPHLRAN